MKMYTLYEVCEILKISRSLLYRLMDKGDLGYHRVGYFRRVSEKQLNQYLQNCNSEVLHI